MTNEIRAFLTQQHMIQPGDRIVCAVSGGADSMALLWSMYLLADSLKISLSAAHFNHRLRGAESDSDEAFVRKFCDLHDIPLTVGSGDVVSGEKGLEAAARDARYGFLESLPGKIATAHTADDNAETILMHLIRGTGLKGLGGISPVRGKLIRPMLTVTRKQVVAFLKENHIPWIEDSSNGSDDFLRNRIRHHVMPLLRQENPRIGENLSDMALQLRLDEQALDNLSKISSPVSVTELRNLAPALRVRALDRFLKESGVREPELEHIRLAESLVFSDRPSARANFPGGIEISRNYDILEVCGKESTLQERLLTCPGVTDLPEAGLRVICESAENLICSETAFTVSVSGPLYVRCRKPGDRIRLPGGTKDLKKLFIDRKIPARQRSLVPVVADSAGILGVYGIGVHRDRAAQTLPGVRIRFEKILPANAERIDKP